MIITSLNLYEFSMNNNKEMGVLVDKNDPADQQLWTDAFAEVDFVNQTSQRFDLVLPKPSPSATKPVVAKATRAPKAEAETGFCIRCAEEIPLNPERPYCTADYKAWAKWENADYEDSHCHKCGRDTTVTMNKPLCKACFAA